MKPPYSQTRIRFLRCFSFLLLLTILLLQPFPELTAESEGRFDDVGIWTGTISFAINKTVEINSDGYPYRTTINRKGTLYVKFNNFLDYKNRGKGYAIASMNDKTTLGDDWETWIAEEQRVQLEDYMTSLSIDEKRKCYTIEFLDLSVHTAFQSSFDSPSTNTMSVPCNYDTTITVKDIPFPATGDVLESQRLIRMKFSVPYCPDPLEELLTVKWRLEPEKTLKADFTVSGNEREYKLNATPSKGDIKEYKWTFAPPEGTQYPEGVQFDAGLELTGKSINLTLVEPVMVILTVSDGKNEEKKKLTVYPNQKKWKTNCGEEPTPEPLPGVRLVCDEDGGYPFGLHLGQNVCALCAKPNFEGTIYHPDSQGSGFNKTWQNTGYTLAEVQNGPFKGTWYVAEYLIKIQRKLLINPDLLPGSIFFRKNLERGTDVQRFYQARRDHEHTHTLLISESLDKGNDPAPNLQHLFDRSETDLAEKVDRELLTKETAICELFLDEELVRSRLKAKWGLGKGRISFPTDLGAKADWTDFNLYYYNFGFQ